MHIRGGRQVLVAGLLMLASVACDAGVHYSVSDTQVSHEVTARPSTAAPSAPAARRSTKATGAAETPASSPAAVPSDTPSRAVERPAAPDCTSRDLTASEGTGRAYNPGQSMRYGVQIVLRNRSGSTCRLSGWPGLTFFGQGTMHVCTTADPPGCKSGPVSTSGTRPFKVTRSRAVAPPAVSLTPGRTTSFTMSWPYCGVDLYAPHGVEIRLPGDSRPLTLAPTKYVIPCDEKLDVTPFGVTT